MCSLAGLKPFTREDVAKKLVNILSKVDGIALAYLIGSVAERGVSHHDVDIAILPKNGVEDELKLLGKVYYRVCRGLHVNEDHVDVVPMNKVDTCFMHKIIAKGIRLVGEESAEKTLIEKLNARLPEIKLLANLSLGEWLRMGDPRRIDWALVKRRVDAAYESLETLHREILSKPLDIVVSSDVLRLAFERIVHMVIESVLDVCRHVVSVRGWGPAETYKDFVRILKEKGILTPQLAEGMIRFVGWRNILVHRYLEVNHARLYEDSKRLSRMIREFERDIRMLKKLE